MVAVSLSVPGDLELCPGSRLVLKYGLERRPEEIAKKSRLYKP